MKHIPWPHLVPAWDVWLGIARLVPAQRFHGTGRRKLFVVTAPAVMIKNVALSSITMSDLFKNALLNYVFTLLM